LTCQDDAIVRRGLILLLIVLVGLGIRISHLASIPHATWDPGLSLPQGEMARNIVDHGRWFVINDAAETYVERLQNERHRLIDPAEIDYRSFDAHPRWQPEISDPVGEAVVLAGLWKLTGSQYYVQLRILQIILDALTALLVYRIVTQLFKRPRAALIGAAFYALFPPIAWLSTMPLPDIWGVDFTVAIVAAFIEALRSAHAWRWLIVCGLLTGIGSYFRPNLLILPVALALAVGISGNWRTALRYAAVPSVVGVLLLTPWIVRNANDFHRFIPTRTGFGQTLWEGLGEVHNDFGAVLSDNLTFQQVHRVRPDLVYGTPAYDSYLQHKAVQAIEHHPTVYLEAVALRIATTTLITFNWGATSPLSYRSATGSGPLAYALDRPFDLLYGLFEPAVFVLAMIALVLTWRGRGREHALLIAALLATLVPYWLIHVESRYVVPAMLTYIIWIALGLDMILERLFARLRYRRTTPPRAPAESPTL
jgi:hypothetical protein